MTQFQKSIQLESCLMICLCVCVMGRILEIKGLVADFNFLPVSVLVSDCESHCKVSKGKMKITMKKYCKKDYGK